MYVCVCGMLTFEANACREISQNILKYCSTIYFVPTSYHRPFRSRSKSFPVVVVVIFFHLFFLFCVIALFGVRHSIIKTVDLSVCVCVWMRIRCFSSTICSLCIALVCMRFKQLFVCNHYKYDVISMVCRTLSVVFCFVVVTATDAFPPNFRMCSVSIFFLVNLMRCAVLCHS